LYEGLHFLWRHQIHRPFRFHSPTDGLEAGGS
jgi:hypothetical protein